MGLNSDALAMMRRLINENPQGLPEDQLMEALLRTSAKWRSQIMANTLITLNGRTVQQGPFAGMDYVNAAAEGSLLARLVGSYESELHPFLETFAKEGLDQVVDVGCAEGYYAVGLARMMPKIVVHAFDIDPVARAGCAELAERNGVSDRVKIGEAFAGEDFARFANTRTLVFMDIEGGERALLRPDLWPALQTLPIIVETHPGPSFAMTREIAERFVATHEVVMVRQAGKNPRLPEWVHSLSHLDQLLAVWEWRRWPTPWLVMRPKTGW